MTILSFVKLWGVPDFCGVGRYPGIHSVRPDERGADQRVADRSLAGESHFPFSVAWLEWVGEHAGKQLS